jgi:GT2 family glycosyltransferase
MFKYDLSIIIVNWNAKDFLFNCINSIIDNTKEITYEIIIIDNNSSDGTTRMVKDNFNTLSNVILISNKDNKGFAGANNQAINISSGKDVLLLNPDTIIQANVICETFKCLEKDRNLAIAGCTVLNPDGSLQLACRRMVPSIKDAFLKLFGFTKLFKKMNRYNLNDAPIDEFLSVDAVSGSYLMIKKEVIDKIGLLDEKFFMYGEDMDWCLSAKMAGYAVRYCPVGTIIHYKGESSKQLSFKANYEFYRSMLIFYKKNNKDKNFFLINWVVYLGIVILGFIAIIKGMIVPNKKVGSKG